MVHHQSFKNRNLIIHVLKDNSYSSMVDEKSGGGKLAYVYAWLSNCVLRNTDIPFKMSRGTPSGTMRVSGWESGSPVQFNITILTYVYCN